MKKLIYLAIVALSFSNCDNKKKDNTELKNEDTTEAVKKSGVETKHNSTNETTSGAFSVNEIENAISEFQDCKAGAVNRSDCRNYLTSFISKKYNLSDFKDHMGLYFVYDSIQPIINRSHNWREVGLATDQAAINTGVNHAENGGLALIIDTSQTYGHLAIIQPEKLIKSSSWGVEVPQVISLSNYKPSKSFYNKAVSYAFKKSNDLKIYVRD